MYYLYRSWRCNPRVTALIWLNEDKNYKSAKSLKRHYCNKSILRPVIYLPGLYQLA